MRRSSKLSRKPGRSPRIVAIGGGSGPSLIARALSDHLDSFAAVVSVADSGSSSGVIRKAFGLPAPGDLRAAISSLVRLSNPGSPWADLLEHRLHPEDGGPLQNMALGNLIMAALSEREHHFGSAIEVACRLFGCRGRVLPVSTEPIHVSARLHDDSIVHGEVAVRTPGKAPIRDLFLDRDGVQAWGPALEAIQEADYLFLGPGNLFTSVVACLVVPGVAEAIRRCRGVRIYIPNTTTYPGQTDGFTVLDHVETVLRYLGENTIEYVVLNCERPRERIAALYEAQGLRFIPVQGWELGAIVRRGIRAVASNLLEPAIAQPRRLHKLDTIRHDPAKLGDSLRTLFGLRAAAA